MGAAWYDIGPVAIQVASALEGSETLQLSEDRQWVKRRKPLPSREQIIQETDNRSALHL